MTSESLEPGPMPRRRLLPWTIAASLLLHVVAYGSLEAAPVAIRAAHRKTQLRFDVVARPKPPEAEPAPPPKVEPPKSRKVPEPKPVTPAQAPAPPADVAPPAAIDGVTLAGEGSGNAFSMPLGSGGSLEPTRARAPAPVNVPAPTEPARPPAPSGPPVVAVGDLSAKPTAPALGSALERNYPADARRRGLSGTAKVRARIDPDGVVRRVALLEESAAGFGNACTRTLSGSRWAAPKDKAGRSVATEIRYICRFVVDP